MSVIRRKHTKNFTTIGNELFNDERLAADEVGILAYLLSQRSDWEIRRPQLRKRWKIGGERMKRIMDNWLRTGWLHAEKTRLSNGQFSIVYEVRDEPGPPLSDEEITAALSVVSTEVGYDESIDDGGLESTGPPQGKPPLGSHLVDSRGSQESTSTDSTNTISTKQLPIWRDIRDAWPAAEILSPLKCEQLFASLSQVDRQKAFDGIKGYLTRCKDRNRKICDLATYLKERRFETVKNGHSARFFPVYARTAQAARLIEYRKATAQPTAFIEECWRVGKPYLAETEWPPALPAKQQSTGPPLPGLTPEDEEEIIKWG